MLGYFLKFFFALLVATSNKIFFAADKKHNELIDKSGFINDKKLIQLITNTICKET
jgi:hypothetical protein